jgi:hypothetical protein
MDTRYERRVLMTYLDQIRAQNMSSSPAIMNTVNPTPNAGAETIVAVVKNGSEITGYKLSSGQVISKQEGIELAKGGHIRGVGIAENRGSEYLRSLPDESESNNLGNLPVIDDTNGTLF